MNKKQIYIVISGKKQHGKNFFASRLKKRIIDENITVVETAFAEPIKRFCHDVFGIPMEDMEKEDGKQKKIHLKWNDLHNALDYTVVEKLEEYITVRELMQVIGTELFRNQFYEQVWAEAPFRKIHTYRAFLGEYEHSLPADVVLITDCRFTNEVVEAQKFDSIVVRVIRPGYKGELDEHESEIALDDWDWKRDELITNTGEQDCFDGFIEDVILPKIKGRLYGK